MGGTSAISSCSHGMARHALRGGEWDGAWWLVVGEQGRLGGVWADERLVCRLVFPIAWGVAAAALPHSIAQAAQNAREAVAGRWGW